MNMNTKKIATLFTAAAMAATLSGCFGDDSEDGDSVSITGFKATVGEETVVLDGTVSSGSSIESVSFMVKDSAGVEVKNAVDYLTIAAYAEGGWKDITSLELGFNEDSTVVSLESEIYLAEIACGSYTVTVTVDGATAEASFSKTTGCVIDTIDVDTSDFTEAQTVTLGAQDNAKESSLDLDAWELYKQADVDSAAAVVIDLVYGVVSGKATIATPTGADVLDMVGGKYADANNDAVIVKLDVASVDEIKKATDLDFNVDDAVFSTEVAEGDVFLVITDKEALFVVGATEIVAGAAGTLSIKAISQK